jgi:hypothetical protein
MQMLFQLSYRPAADIVANRREPGWPRVLLTPRGPLAPTMTSVSIDLNADLPIITSANIACGGHAAAAFG